MNNRFKKKSLFCTQVLGGYLARVVGVKYLFAVGVGCTAALTLLNKVAARASTGLLCEPNFLGGWPLSFYLFGTIGVRWSLGWLFFI